MNPIHDPLRTKWLVNEVQKEVQSEQMEDEELFEIEEITPTKSKKRRKISSKNTKTPKTSRAPRAEKVIEPLQPARKHGEFVINMTARPIFINGIGNHHTARQGIQYQAIKLGVVADDPNNPESGIFDIRNISDEDLDNCPYYMTFFNKKSIVEISEKQKNVILQRVNLIQEKYAYQYSTFNRLITPNPLVSGHGTSFMPSSAIQRDQNTIETINMGNSRSIETDTYKIEVDGIGVVRNNYDAMSDFFKNI